MPKFAANLTMMYSELEFLDRFKAAAQDGFDAVEYLFPYDYPAHVLREQLEKNDLQQVLFNAPAGGNDMPSIQQAWGDGQRGTASIPGLEDEFRYGVLKAIEYAVALNCPRIHVMAGLISEEHSAEQRNATYLSNLSWAGEQAQQHHIDILIEPINQRDMPGYFLSYQKQAHDVVQTIRTSNLKVQMDLYHCQIMEGDLATQLKTYLPTGRVGHIQIAGVPQRHEPSIGEVNYTYLFDLIDDLSQEFAWQGWIGGEYKPRLGGAPGGTSQGLDWFAPYRRVDSSN